MKMPDDINPRRMDDQTRRALNEVIAAPRSQGASSKIKVESEAHARVALQFLRRKARARGIEVSYELTDGPINEPPSFMFMVWLHEKDDSRVWIIWEEYAGLNIDTECVPATDMTGIGPWD